MGYAPFMGATPSPGIMVIGPHPRSPRIEGKLITPTNQEHPTALAD